MSRARHLARLERTAVVVVELHRRQHGRGPSYGWLARQLGLERQAGACLIRRLHREGMLVSTSEANSLAATAEGLRAALRKDGDR